ncbi:unnamed protein product [Closterium sp. NIES-54]
MVFRVGNHYSHYLPPARRALVKPACRALLLRTSRPAAARTSRPAALRVAPCCSQRVTSCCSQCVVPYCSQRVAHCRPARRALLQPARHALLHPARRALLPCESRPVAASASRPTVASASRSAALHVAPCCSQRVAPYCSQRVALCCPLRRALLQPAPPLSRPAATTSAAAARATAAAGGGAAGSAGSAAGAEGTGGATGSAVRAPGARGAGPTTDSHCLSWPLSRQLQRLGRARPCGGGFGFLRTAQRRQQETFSPQVLGELFPQRCVTGYVEAAALGASESAAALGASESIATLGASEMSGLIPLFMEGSVWRSVRWLRRVRYLHLASLQRLARIGYSPTRLSSGTTASVTPPYRISAICIPVSLSQAFPSPCPPSRTHLPRRTFPVLRGGRHSSEFPPTTAPLHTLQMDVWGQAPVGGMDQERYFLLVVDDYTRYTTVFSLRCKADISGLPSPASAIRQGRELSFEFSQEFSQDEGIVQSFTLPASPQQK